MNAQHKADEALRALLRTQYDREPAVILDSPPGASKTGAVERLAAQALARRGERVMIAVQTNAQALDLSRRLATGFPGLPFHLLHAKERESPEALRALLARHPGVRVLRLPVSRRLVQSTVDVVQPAFYPALPFEALAELGARGIRFGRPAEPGDEALERLAGGESLVWRGLPEGAPGVNDPALAQDIATGVARLFAREAVIWDHEGERPLRPAEVGVVCTHVAQVAAVRERLGARGRPPPP